MSRRSPTATPPTAIFAFFDMCVASFAATAALCLENGSVFPAVPGRDPDTTLSRVPYSTLSGSPTSYMCRRACR